MVLVLIDQLIEHLFLISFRIKLDVEQLIHAALHALDFLSREACSDAVQRGGVFLAAQLAKLGDGVLHIAGKIPPMSPTQLGSAVAACATVSSGCCSIRFTKAL